MSHIRCGKPVGPWVGEWAAKGSYTSELSRHPCEAMCTLHSGPYRIMMRSIVAQFDGVASGSDRLVVLGATNRPWDLDEAVSAVQSPEHPVSLLSQAGRFCWSDCHPAAAA